MRAALRRADHMTSCRLIGTGWGAGPHAMHTSTFNAETLTDAKSTDARAVVVLFMFSEAINALLFGKVERDCGMFT